MPTTYALRIATRSWGVLPLCTFLCAAACGSAPDGTADGADGGAVNLAAGGDGAIVGPDSDGAIAPGADGAMMSIADLGPCQASPTLASALVVHSVAVTGASGGRAIVAQRTGGLAAAWSGGGTIHVTSLDANDAQTGSGVTLAGTNVFGLVAGAADFAVLVSRPPDYMTFAKIDTTGTAIATKNLLGGGDHTVVGTEWFGEFAQTARLAANGTGYVAYTALHRHWPDGISHQGDTLRPLAANGDPASGNTWDWGCSHSMDQRLAVSGTQVGAFCISDCYPQKAINYNWMGGVISDEPAGNCAGGVDASLGGAAPVSGGIWFTYVSGNGRATKDIGVVKVAANGTQTLKAFITNDATVESNVHLAAYVGGLLLAYESGGQTYLQKLDATTGQPIGAREQVAVLKLDAASDLITDTNGDVVAGWLEGGALKIARVRACVP